MSETLPSASTPVAGTGDAWPLPAALSSPVLEGGDRLTRVEFERRYACRTDIKKAELIEGVVYMASPVRTDLHAEPHAALMTWLGMYRLHTPGIRLADNATVRLDGDNEPQPDALLHILSGGQAHLDDDGYIAGAPELVAEIAASSASYDLHDKLRVYRRNGVREYLVWQTFERRIDWFELVDDEYRSIAPDVQGVVRSRVFPGLDLVVDGLLANDLAAVAATLGKGLATAEHEAFVVRLRSGTVSR